MLGLEARGRGRARRLVYAAVRDYVPLRAGDRVTIERGEIHRGVVRGGYHSVQDNTGTFFVDLVDRNRPAEFSSTTSSTELQQLESTVIYSDGENKTWIRGWVDAEEAKAIFVAEALL